MLKMAEIVTEPTAAAPNWRRKSDSNNILTDTKFELSKDEIMEEVYP